MWTLVLVPVAFLTLACAAVPDEGGAESRIAELERELAAANEELAGLRPEVARLRELQAERERIEVERWPRDGRCEWERGAQDRVQPEMVSVVGVVTGVDEDLNIVLISVGTDDRVAAGYIFKVFRSAEFVGILVVDGVGPDWASGHMKKDETKAFPRRGDDVATNL